MQMRKRLLLQGAAVAQGRAFPHPLWLRPHPLQAHARRPVGRRAGARAAHAGAAAGRCRQHSQQHGAQPP